MCVCLHTYTKYIYIYISIYTYIYIYMYIHTQNALLCACYIDTRIERMAKTKPLTRNHRVNPYLVSTFFALVQNG